MRATPISQATGSYGKEIKLRTIKKDGLTVSELIHKLSYFRGDMKVMLTTEKGDAYPVIQAMQDSKNTVMIF